uniref:Uncharacterized protein n=1 Tax=Rhizophora mucronata TaxID=61149 RepID=A0A2P2QDF0_RHIMU
MGTRCFILGMI